MFRRLIILLPFLLIAAFLFLAFTQYQRWHVAPLPVAVDGELIDVQAGVPLDRLAEQLEAAGIIDYAWDLKLLARLRGDAGRVKAGEYDIEPGLTLAGLLDKLVAGRVRLYALTVVEGTTVRQLLQQLAAHPAIRQTLTGNETPVTLAATLGLPQEHAEGWFLPETYHFPRGTTDADFLRRAHQAMRDVLDAAWAGRAEGLPLENAYDALILASIVEKETARADERPLIAGVFVRRLQKGMRLQTDPTVIYGIGADFDGNLTRQHLQTDTPYNTYTRSSLPPTPIAMPGRAAIRAALNPAPGDALYFVATGLGDGSHVFSATMEEHEAAVAAYLKRLRETRNEAGQ